MSLQTLLSGLSPKYGVAWRDIALGYLSVAAVLWLADARLRPLASAQISAARTLRR